MFGQQKLNGEDELSELNSRADVISRQIEAVLEQISLISRQGFPRLLTQFAGQQTQGGGEAVSSSIDKPTELFNFSLRNTKKRDEDMIDNNMRHLGPVGVYGHFRDLAEKMKYHFDENFEPGSGLSSLEGMTKTQIKIESVSSIVQYINNKLDQEGEFPELSFALDFDNCFAVSRLLEKRVQEKHLKQRLKILKYCEAYVGQVANQVSKSRTEPGMDEEKKHIIIIDDWEEGETLSKDLIEKIEVIAKENPQLVFHVFRYDPMSVAADKLPPGTKRLPLFYEVASIDSQNTCINKRAFDLAKLEVQLKILIDQKKVIDQEKKLVSLDGLASSYFDSRSFQQAKNTYKEALSLRKMMHEISRSKNHQQQMNRCMHDLVLNMYRLGRACSACDEQDDAQVLYQLALGYLPEDDPLRVKIVEQQVALAEARNSCVLC